eukprot:2350837-Prymnesium_polylepis.1
MVLTINVQVFDFGRAQSSHGRLRAHARREKRATWRTAAAGQEGAAGGRSDDPAGMLPWLVDRAFATSVVCVRLGESGSTAYA